MTTDVENLTGNPTAPNRLYCGPLPCIVFGGSGNDTILGDDGSDIIVGGGGADSIATRGGIDVMDLNHPAGPRCRPWTATTTRSRSSSRAWMESADACARANAP